MEKSFNEVFSFKGIYVSILHILDTEKAFALATADSAYYVHLAQRRDSMIVRLVALGGEWSDVEEALKDHGWDDVPGFIDFCQAAHDAGYEVIHFDTDCDLVPGAAWRDVDQEITLTPVELRVDVQNFYELDDEQRAFAISEFSQQEEAEDGEDIQDDLFVQVEGRLYNLSSEVMRDPRLTAIFDDAAAGVYGENAFSCLGFVVSDDDGYYADVYRITA
jgi:hypothetical protein